MQVMRIGARNRFSIVKIDRRPGATTAVDGSVALSRVIGAP
jgi:hypothetical protein